MSDANTSQYFYMAGRECRGPLPFEQLLQQPIHRQTRVWSKNMSDWQPAQDVPGLADLIPPPPPTAESSTSPATAGQPKLERYADALRQLNISLLILIGGTLILSMLSGEAFGVAYLIAAVVWASVLHRAARAVPVSPQWLWAVGGVLPVVGYVPLIVLHNKLKKPLEAAGYRIRFLGRATSPADGSVSESPQTHPH